MRSLVAGDGVSIVAPAGPVDGERLDRGIAKLESWGLQPRPASHVRERQGFLAGDDARRADDLITAFGDPQSGAVFYARGGYGTTRLLPRLPLQGLARSRKLLVGFSDLTALGLALNLFEEREIEERVAILLTDGNDTGSVIPPEQAAAIAADQGVMVHVVGVGSTTVQLSLIHI